MHADYFSQGVLFTEELNVLKESYFHNLLIGCVWAAEFMSQQDTGSPVKSTAESTIQHMTNAT